MKTLKTALVIMVFIVLGACQKMDYNYEQYLDTEKIYSPCVRNLKAQSLLKEVILTWENPPGNMAKTLVIDYQDSIINTTGMVDSIKITGLDIMGYTITVQTRDEYGNLSVPALVSAFPIGNEMYLPD